jgi:hypothetical protein
MTAIGSSSAGRLTTDDIKHLKGTGLPENHEAKMNRDTFLTKKISIDGKYYVVTKGYCPGVYAS